MISKGPFGSPKQNSERVGRSSSFVRRQSVWDKSIPQKVGRTARPHLSTCVRALNLQNFDHSRPVPTDDPTPKRRINTDQCGNAVLMGLEQIMLVVGDQAHSLRRPVAL